MQASARFASSRKVVVGISDAVARSCCPARRGKTNVSSLSTEEPLKGRKRVTKEERRVRVEVLVENYRASDEEKFPGATSVRQQVGGSYYTARELLQEYNSRLKSNGRNISLKFQIRELQGNKRAQQHGSLHKRC